MKNKLNEEKKSHGKLLISQTSLNKTSKVINKNYKLSKSHNIKWKL